MMDVNSTAYDLWYDANTVGADLVVETWISHGPRADDSSFDPHPGDWVVLGDEDEAPQQARVIRRERQSSVGADRAADRVCARRFGDRYPLTPIRRTYRDPESHRR